MTKSLTKSKELSATKQLQSFKILSRPICHVMTLNCGALTQKVGIRLRWWRLIAWMESAVAVGEVLRVGSAHRLIAIVLLAFILRGNVHWPHSNVRLGNGILVTQLSSIDGRLVIRRLLTILLLASDEFIEDFIVDQLLDCFNHLIASRLAFYLITLRLFGKLVWFIVKLIIEHWHVVSIGDLNVRPLSALRSRHLLFPVRVWCDDLLWVAVIVDFLIGLGEMGPEWVNEGDEMNHKTK